MNSDKSPTRCHRTWEFICAVTLLCPEAPPPQSYPSSLSITVFLATFLVSSLIPGSWGLRDDKDIHLRLGEEETFLKVWSLALLLFWKCLWLLRVVSFFSRSQSSLYKRIVSVHSLQQSHAHYFLARPRKSFRDRFNMDQSKTPNQEQEPVKKEEEDNSGTPGASKYSSLLL